MRILLFSLLLSSNIFIDHNSVLSTERVLPPCPNTPNCVSTQAVKKSKKMEPISFSGDEELCIERLLKLISTYDNAELVEQDGNYLHYEFTTKIGKFIDDIEFLIDDSAKLIHYRSASREGYGDFNKNKRRMKKIVKAWKKMTSD